jgi:capsular polysaccharide biosynthesis protein
VIIFNLRAISSLRRNLVRRHKWRFRPLKRAVLPARSVNRALLRLFSTPPRIEGSTLTYAAAHPEISVREIHPAEPVVVPPVPFSNAFPHEETSAPAFVFEIPNVNFWAYYGGAVVTSDSALLADLSPEVWGIRHHPIFSRWRLPQSQLLAGRTGIAVTPEAATNYYHWTLDALPRLLLLKHATGNFANYDTILLGGGRWRYETESVAALEVPADKIRYVGSGNRFEIASAVIPSIDHSAKIIAPWKIRALRQLVSDEGASRRRFYISRRRAAVRRIENENENEIVALLRAHGFENLELEDFSWCEQARLFAGAEVIIAPHGAALANTVFCAPGTWVVEISTRAGYRDWYLQLAAAAQLRYRWLEAAPAARRSFKSRHAPENDDMVVGHKTVEQFLARL